MKMKIPHHMGISNLRREDIEDGIFLFYSFGEGQIRPLRTVGNMGVFLIMIDQQLSHIIQGEAETGMHLRRRFKSPFNQFCIDQLSDERCRQQTDPRCNDLLLHLFADFASRFNIHSCL